MAKKNKITAAVLTARAIQKAHYAVRNSKVSEKLVANISKYPTNLEAAMKLTANQTGLSFYAVRALWYKKGGIRDQKPAFIMQSSEGIVINSKNMYAKGVTKRTVKLAEGMVDIKGLDDQTKLALFGIIHSNIM